MTSAVPTTVAAFGAWPSTISAARVAAGATPLSTLMLGGADGNDIFWLAGRAAEAGRNTLLRCHGAATEELTPAPFNVRTRVHEYGGGAYAVDGETVYFSHFADNCIYRINAADDDILPVAVTRAGKQRFADFVVDRARRRLIGVRELHGDDPHAQPVNTLCAISLDGAPAAAPGEETVLVHGADFYSSPRLSPDGRSLAWLSWDHPGMPWQGTTLWLADIADDGTLSAPVRIAGGAEESICQPEWSPDNGCCTSSPTAADGGTCTACAATASAPKACARRKPNSPPRTGPSATRCTVSARPPKSSAPISTKA
jgi:hypothetical protein